MKVDLAASRIARRAIRQSYEEAARARGSLELIIRDGHAKQTLQITERLKNGDTQFVTVNYDGEIVSESALGHNSTGLREFSRKPIRSKPLVNSSFYIRAICDIWHNGPSNYYPRGYDRDALEYDSVVVEAWELPTEPIKVYRLTYDDLLVSFRDTDALQLTMMARRKKISVTEAPTNSHKLLHTLEEIVSDTLQDCAAEPIDSRRRAIANRGLSLLPAFINDRRKHLLY